MLHKDFPRVWALMTVEEFRLLLVPILILVGFVAAGYILRFVLTAYITRLARKTKTKIDDIIFDAIKTPIALIFLIIGINFALAQAPFVPAQIMQYLPIISSIIIILIGTVVAARIITGILKYYSLTRPSMKSLVPIFSKLITQV